MQFFMKFIFQANKTLQNANSRKSCIEKLSVVKNELNDTIIKNFDTCEYEIFTKRNNILRASFQYISSLKKLPEKYKSKYKNCQKSDSLQTIAQTNVFCPG